MAAWTSSCSLGSCAIFFLSIVCRGDEEGACREGNEIGRHDAGQHCGRLCGGLAVVPMSWLPVWRVAGVELRQLPTIA